MRYMKIHGCRIWSGVGFPPKIIIQIAEFVMSSRITLDNILFSNNPCLFSEGIELQITFSALQPVPAPLEWKIIYVGSAKNEQYDQVLEEFEIGPIEEQSTMKFKIECSPPDFTKIPPDEIICVTALIMTVSYKAQEFIRVGYYVHNGLAEGYEPSLTEQASLQTLIKHTKRTVLTDKPRITKFKIDWGDQIMREETNNNSKQTNNQKETNNNPKDRQQHGFSGSSNSFDPLKGHSDKHESHQSASKEKQETVEEKQGCSQMRSEMSGGMNSEQAARIEEAI